MKKLTAVFIMLLFVFMFASCDSDELHKEPNYSESPSNNSEHKHTEEIIPAIAATCTTQGKTTGKKCSECGEIIVEQQEIPLEPHNMNLNSGKIIKEPTCTELGQIKYTCSVCNLEDIRSVDMIQHAYIYDEWFIDTQATCRSEGSMSIHCANCSNKTQVTPIPATGTHIYNGVDDKCTMCDQIIEYTSGLSFSPIKNNTEYEVYSVGSVTDSFVVIPKMYEGKPVTAIGEFAFDSCSTLEAVYLPVGITSIGNNAFANCDKLAYICLPSTLTSIGDFAFRYSAIQTIQLPNNIKSIGNYAFQGSRLKTITFPESLESIGNCAFNKCSDLESITIPSFITEIEDSAFNSCKLLTTVVLHDNITKIGASAFEFCPSLVNITIPDSVISIGSGAFSECTSLITKERGISYVGNWIIHVDSSVSSLKVREGIVGLADRVCSYNPNLSSVELPTSLKYIGDSVFEQCSNLTEINYLGTKQQWSSFVNDDLCKCTIYCSNGLIFSTICSTGLEYLSFGDGTCTVKGIGTCQDKVLIIPEKSPSGDIVVSIYKAAFKENSDIVAVSFPNTLTTIGESAFSNCNLKEIVFPESLEIIDDYSFTFNQSLQSITFNNKLESIGMFAFAHTSVRTIELGSNLEVMSSHVFYNCQQLETISFGNGIKSLGVLTFYQAYSLKKIVLPETLTILDYRLFEDCTNLEEIQIGKNVETIHDNSFSGCSNLRKIVFTGTVDEWNLINKSDGWDSDLISCEIIFMN